jgi:hypothetical protein
MNANLNAPQATIIAAAISLFGIVVTKLMDDWLDRRKSTRAKILSGH